MLFSIYTFDVTVCSFPKRTCYFLEFATQVLRFLQRNILNGIPILSQKRCKNKQDDLHFLLAWEKQPPELFYKKSVVKNFAKFTGKHLCHRIFFNKVLGWCLQLIKKETLTWRFSVNFAKFLTTLFLTEHIRMTDPVLTRGISEISCLLCVCYMNFYFRKRVRIPNT